MPVSYTHLDVYKRQWLFRYGRYYSLAMERRTARVLLSGGGGLLPAEGLGQGGEVGDGQTLPPNGGGQAAGLNGCLLYTSKCV